jgi:hypothetical protein
MFLLCIAQRHDVYNGSKKYISENEHDTRREAVTYGMI